jgi:peptidoglycan hydrolase-like protein with peptidoglycan-binding domain
VSRRKALAGLVTLVVVAGIVGGGVWAVRTLPKAPAASAPSPMPEPKTVQVTRKTLQVQASLSGTLGYAGSIDIAGGLAGTLTWVPEAGSVIVRGGQLYEVDGGRKAILMYGDRPAWRSLSMGVPNGRDVEQLKKNLLALGYTPSGMAIDGHWDRNTTLAVKRWQKAAGLAVDGTVDLGEVVFLPGPFRLTTAAALGSGTSGGNVLHGTTDKRVVSLSLEATRRDLVSAGGAVSVSLPDGSTVAGHVTEIGRVAHSNGGSGSGAGGGGGSTPTIDVTVSLDDPTAAPDLDQAPVTVRIVTSSRPNVLAVPVNSLVALLEGGYAVEVVASNGSRRYVGVGLGLFDSGWVEISTGDVREGDRVVVPS